MQNHQERKKTVRKIYKEVEVNMFINDKQRTMKLTKAFKERVALDIKPFIEKGNNTFYKLKKVLPQYEDRELKAGLKYASKNYLPRAIFIGKGVRARMAIENYLIVKPKTKKIYQVVKL